MITDEIRARIEAGTAVLWCAHAGSGPLCTDLVSHTAVGWLEVGRMLVELGELIYLRSKMHYSLRTRPELIVRAHDGVLVIDPTVWADIAREGPAVGIFILADTWSA